MIDVRFSSQLKKRRDRSVLQNHQPVVQCIFHWRALPKLLDSCSTCTYPPVNVYRQPSMPCFDTVLINVLSSSNMKSLLYARGTEKSQSKLRDLKKKFFVHEKEKKMSSNFQLFPVKKKCIFCVKKLGFFARFQGSPTRKVGSQGLEELQSLS